METVNRSALSPALVRCGRNIALPFQNRSSRPWSAPSLMRGRGKHQVAAVNPRLELQVRAKEKTQTSRNDLCFPDHESDEEIRENAVGLHLVAAGVSIAAAGHGEVCRRSELEIAR